MFFVAGITGHIGGAAARTLLAQGRQIRALLRDPAKGVDWRNRGVDVHTGDLADPVALAVALDGGTARS